MEVKYMKYGTGAKVGDKIYLNSKLKTLPELHTAILNHELSHSNDWTLKDTLLDIRNPNLKGMKKEYYKFIFTTPSSWTILIPLWKYEDEWTIDPNLLMMYFVVGIIFTLWRLMLV